MVSCRSTAICVLCFRWLAHLSLAGMPVEKVQGSKTSVYTGCFTNDWQQICFKDSEQCSNYAALGVETCMISNRISWFFNFTGASANVDSACSSSLVALDLACKDLITKDANMVCHDISYIL